MIKLNTTELLQKEMDRKDFLKHVGIGLVAMTGFAAAFKAMGFMPTGQNSQLALNSQSNPKQTAAGYGASVYGGVPTRG